ncbi:MAG: ankyrin repeat domain-containing protein [Pyrinomonadaceae bacterium]
MQKSAFLDLIQLVVDGNADEVARVLRTQPELALMASPRGATRQQSTECFYPAIGHYLYAGDTALHMAAAAISKAIAKQLIFCGADPRARNRRGAEPLHYAADSDRLELRAQADVIEYLVSVGADPNAVDKSGVAPLHRAVRRRSLAACRALLDGGADPRRRNGSGSTPLHLAVQTTGASGSGADTAREQQAEIIQLLIRHGAKSTDVDAKGKQVYRAATSEWIRDLLTKY